MNGSPHYHRIHERRNLALPSWSWAKLTVLFAIGAGLWAALIIGALVVAEKWVF